MGHLRIEFIEDEIDINMDLTEVELIQTIGSIADALKPKMSIIQQAAIVGTFARVMFKEEAAVMLEHIKRVTLNADKDGV